MTAAPALDEVAAIITDLIALGSNAWVVIEAEGEQVTAVTSFIREELRGGEEEGATSVETIAAPNLVAQELPWVETRDVRGLLVLGIESLSTEQLAQLDLDRGRFVESPVITVITTPEGASRLATHAPNIWSWVGPMYFRAVEPEPMDVETRIRSIRDELGISEEEMVQRIHAGSIVIDPAVAEWLVLIDREDLIGG